MAALLRYFKIYIPVWIDLKLSLKKQVIINTLIYIPVWIDLKSVLQLQKLQMYIHLHSSMDRFEVIFKFCIFYGWKFTFQYG